MEEEIIERSSSRVGKQFEKSIERFLNDKPAEDFQKNLIHPHHQ